MSVISHPEDDGVNKHIMRVVRNDVKAEADLRQLKLFDVRNSDGKKIVTASKNRVKTSVMNQILLEHRDNYVTARDQGAKYVASYERLEKEMIKTDQIDGKTLAQILALINKNGVEASRHLEAMGKNVLNQHQEISKGSTQMQNTLKDIAHGRQQMKIHSDKMELKWADIEKATGMSREEIEKQIYGEDDD